MYIYIYTSCNTEVIPSYRNAGIELRTLQCIGHLFNKLLIQRITDPCAPKSQIKNKHRHICPSKELVRPRNARGWRERLLTKTGENSNGEEGLVGEMGVCGGKSGDDEKMKNEKCLFSNTQEFLHNIFIKSFK